MVQLSVILNWINYTVGSGFYEISNPDPFKFIPIKKHPHDTTRGDNFLFLFESARCKFLFTISQFFPSQPPEGKSDSQIFLWLDWLIQRTNDHELK